MTKTNQLCFEKFSGDAKLTQSKNSIIIKYDKSLTTFSILIIIFAFLLTSYVAFTDEKNASFPLKVILSLASIIYVYFFIRIVSFFLGPFGAIFRTSKRIDVATDLIYADSSTVTSIKVSKLGVTAKFASLAMAGALTEQGKKVGRNLYLGAAVMAPDTYNKTSHIVTFIHKNGVKGTLVTDDLSCGKVISAVNQDDLDVANEYLMYLNDSKNNRDLSSNEVSNELQRLSVELATKSELSRFGANVEARQVATAACKVISTRMKLFEILNAQIRDR